MLEEGQENSQLFKPCKKLNFYLAEWRFNSTLKNVYTDFCILNSNSQNKVRSISESQKNIHISSTANEFFLFFFDESKLNHHLKSKIITKMHLSATEKSNAAFSWAIFSAFHCLAKGFVFFNWY